MKALTTQGRYLGTEAFYVLISVQLRHQDPDPQSQQPPPPPHQSLQLLK